MIAIESHDEEKRRIRLRFPPKSRDSWGFLESGSWDFPHCETSLRRPKAMEGQAAPFHCACQ